MNLDDLLRETSTVFATDLDGSLLDFCDDPEKVVAPAAMQAGFARMQKANEGRVFVITARPVSFVDNVVFPGLSVAGSFEHHAVARFETGREAVSMVEIPDWKDLDPRFSELAKAHGITIEKRDFSRTFHWRKAPQKNHEQIEFGLARDLKEIFDRHSGSSLEVKAGSMILEVSPPAANKGKALTDILDHLEADRAKRGIKGEVVPVFMGDAETDIPAGEVAQKRGGVFIAVGPNEKVKRAADVHLASPAEARGLIERHP